jgi:pantetheine-phosphate adenylyltransferase
MVADFCGEKGVKYYIRGLRNNMDYNYEENIAQINHLINPDLETIYMRAEDTDISSTMIRELMKYGKDVSPYVPDAVMKAME